MHIDNSKYFYLLGAFRVDGHFNLKKKIIQISVIDYDFLNKIKFLIKELYDKDLNITVHNEAHDNIQKQWRINFSCAALFNNGEWDKSILPQTMEEKIQYLKGFWDAEGHAGIYARKITRKGKEYIGTSRNLDISQKNTTTLDLLHDYMQELGISSIKIYRKDSRSCLKIRQTESIRKFSELINFSIKRKQEALSNILDKLVGPQMTLEEQNKVIAIYNKTNFGAHTIGKMFGKSKYAILSLLKRKGINSTKENGRQVTYEEIEYAEQVIGKPLPFKVLTKQMKKYSPEGLNGIKIKSITFSHEECGVDLSTPGPTNFILANNLLSSNSTIAMQMACYLDWLLSGGKTHWDADGRVVGMTTPNKPLRFSLDNVVFTPEDLISITKEKGKHEKHNVFVLDEGREGLLGARAMESTNKRFDDYFQTCGVYNNFVIIVLPDYFKLAEQYCVNRSLFLINTFHKDFERGYFSFFNTLQKERLYFFGKKRLGITARYSAASRNFWGRFSRWLPFDLNKYEDKKKAAIAKSKWSKYDLAQMKQRDMLCYLIYKNTNWSMSQIAEHMAELGVKEYTETLVERSLKNAKRILENKKYVADEDQMLEEPVNEVEDIKQLEIGAKDNVEDEGKELLLPANVYDNTDVSSIGSAKGKNVKPKPIEDLASPFSSEAFREFSEKVNRELQDDRNLKERQKKIRAEIVNADDLYGDDGISENKYNMIYHKPRTGAHEYIPVGPDPDKIPLPGEKVDVFKKSRTEIKNSTENIRKNKLAAIKSEEDLLEEEINKVFATLPSVVDKPTTKNKEVSTTSNISSVDFKNKFRELTKE